MSDDFSALAEALGPHIKISQRLVKWDGEPPEGAEPIGHPQCIEVLAIEDGQIQILYRREQE